MSRFVVTGGAGFIGSHVCDRLLAEGHHVLCVDNFITGNIENLQRTRSEPRFDLSIRDVAASLHIPGKVDGIFHLASPASPVDYLEHPLETLRTGSLGTFNVLELARDKACRILVCSTSEVYGDPEQHPQRESYFGNVNPIGPRAVYDEAKRFMEACTMAYHRKHTLPIRIARIFNTYGPRMRLEDGRVVPNFVSQALRGIPLTIYGDGSQTRSFCYVDDLVEGLFRLFHSDICEPVNLGNPIEHTILEFARKIVAAVSSRSILEFRELPIDDPKQRRPDITRARAELDFHPKVPLDVGIQRTIDYFRRVMTRDHERTGYAALG
ncbi:MAG: UDP-glucuronic acid decarboxylase family protein [Myxococcota bacterium]